MSFGFGVGDFLAVIELANKIHKRFSDAPAKFKDISYEAESLSVVLSDVVAHADTVVENLHPSKTGELKTILDGSYRVLKNLENLFTRYENVGLSPGASEKHRVKRVWERLMLDPGDISDLRARITSNITLLEAFISNVTGRKTQKSLARLEKQIDVQEQEQALEWISKDCKRHTGRLNTLLSSHEPGTRKWLFDSPEWQTWTSDQGQGTTLYCPGIPGAGKTYASAMLIDRLYTLFPSDEIGIAYAFCDYQRSDEREHVNLARNLLRMILEQPHAWPVTVCPIYEAAKRSRAEVSFDEAFDLLKDVMRLRTRNFVVIDALDELHQDARDVLIPKLFELQRCTCLNIFVTSRDIAQISDLFCSTPQVRIKATGEDIEQYISTHMATLPSFVSGNMSLQNEIKESVVQAAGEMFLLADLHLRSLKSKSSPKALRKALQRFISGQDSTKEALENAMERVTSQPEETASMALKALMILTTARRPLTVDELCHALAIDLEDLEDGFDEENIPPIDYVLSSCAGLVIVETQSQPARQTGPEGAPSTTLQGAERPSGSRLVQVAHKSIRDYLSSPHSGWFSHAEAKMAAICRIYKQAYDESDTEQGYHFLDYVLNHWGYHHIKSDQEVSEASIKCDIDVRIARQASFPLAARQAGDHFGLRQLALELDDMPEHLLMWACYNDKTNVVDILLANNLESYQRPLARMNRSLINERGCGYAWCSVHGNVKDIYPCSVAPPESNEGSLDACTRIISDRRILSGALVAAVSNGRMSLVETFMGYGASIAGRDQDGFTALGVAAMKGHSDMLGWILSLDSMDAKLLLEFQPRLVLQPVVEAGRRKWGLQPRLPIPKSSRQWEVPTVWRYIPGETRDGRVAVTALVAAAFSGHETCVRMLLEWAQKHKHEVPADEWKASCMNAMLCALIGGHISVMRVLLPFIDLNYPAPGFNRYTLLHFAVAMQNLEAVRLILADTTLDPNLGDIHGRTALALAARVGADDLILELWNRGEAKIDPLAVLESLLQDHDTAFRLLCRLFQDCNPGGLFATDSSGYSCLDRILFHCTREWAISRQPRFSKKRTFSSDIESIDALTWNPLRLARLKNNSSEYRDSLEKLGAKLLDRDNKPIFCKDGHRDGEYHFGVTTLYLALASRSYGLLQALLQLCPASVCNVHSGGGTSLMAAFIKGGTQSIDLILETLKQQKDSTVVNSVTDLWHHSALTAAVSDGRVNHRKQFQSLLMFDGFDLRLAFRPNKDGDCPIMTLVSMTVQQTVLPLHLVKPEQKAGMATTCMLLYRYCWQLFKTLSDSLDGQEFSDLFFRLSEDLFDRRGLRFIDCLCQLPQPGCLELVLQSCPALRTQLHVPDAGGTTPLMYASKDWKRNSTFMFVLKTSEVDVGHRDGEGRTALSHVAENLEQFSDGGVATTLIEEYGQDPLATDNHGWSPLRYAVCNGHVWEGSPYHQLLAGANTPMDWTDEHGSTPLHLAIKGGSPLAVKLLLQHSSSSSWLNAPDADGLVPLAHFFSTLKGSDSQKSKYMCNFRMRYPHSGPRRRVMNVETYFQYHREAKEAIQTMLSRPDMLPDIPDKEGKTPLWHALDGVRQEYAGFRKNVSDAGGFHNFLWASIEALCDHDDVDPQRATGLGETPLELAIKLVKLYNNGKSLGVESLIDGDVDSPTPGDDNRRAKLRATIKALRPIVGEPGTLTRYMSSTLPRIQEQRKQKEQPMQVELGQMVVFSTES